ncbi:hypothetical protein MRX96_030813 [Rhipicephalus microplus]
MSCVLYGTDRAHPVNEHWRRVRACQDFRHCSKLLFQLPAQTYEEHREFHQAVRHRGDAKSSSDSKPQGDASCEKFSATLAKLTPSHAVLYAMNTVDIPVRHPPRDHSQLAVHLRCPTMHVCLVSAAISPLSGCVVLAKNSRPESSFVCTTASSFELLTADVVDTVGFQKVEPGEYGQVLYEDLTSRRMIFEHLLHVVMVGEDTGTSSCRVKCFSDRVHFHPTRCHHALHPRLAMDPCHLTLFAIVFLSLWSLCWGSPGNSIMVAYTGHRFARVSHQPVVYWPADTVEEQGCNAFHLCSF